MDRLDENGNLEELENGGKFEGRYVTLLRQMSGQDLVDAILELSNENGDALLNEIKISIHDLQNKRHEINEQFQDYLKKTRDSLEKQLRENFGLLKRERPDLGEDALEIIWQGFQKRLEEEMNNAHEIASQAFSKPAGEIENDMQTLFHLEQKQKQLIDARTVLLREEANMRLMDATSIHETLIKMEKEYKESKTKDPELYRSILHFRDFYRTVFASKSASVSSLKKEISTNTADSDDTASNKTDAADKFLSAQHTLQDLGIEETINKIGSSSLSGFDLQKPLVPFEQISEFPPSANREKRSSTIKEIESRLESSDAPFHVLLAASKNDVGTRKVAVFRYIPDIDEPDKKQLIQQVGDKTIEGGVIEKDQEYRSPLHHLLHQWLKGVDHALLVILQPQKTEESHEWSLPIR